MTATDRHACVLRLPEVEVGESAEATCAECGDLQAAIRRVADGYGGVPTYQVKWRVRDRGGLWMTAADRPPVTDNARAEAVRIIDSSVPDDVPGYRIRYAEKAADALIERGLLAAGRAETTTEDEACGDYPAPCNCDDPETHDGALRTETTTATTEDALADLAHLILDTLHFEPSTRDAEMDDVMDVLRRHLLATARTRPTREQIDAAVGAVLWNASNYPNPSAVLGLDISALRSKVTAAVLALLEGGDDR